MAGACPARRFEVRAFAVTRRRVFVVAGTEFQDLTFKFKSPGFRVWGWGFRLQASSCRVQDLFLVKGELSLCATRFPVALSTHREHRFSQRDSRIAKAVSESHTAGYSVRVD